MLNRLTMARWGRAILIPVVIFVIVFSMLAVVARQYAALQQDQARAEDLKSGVTGLYLDLQEAESGVRAFILSGNEAYLDALTQAQTAIPAALEKIAPLVPQGPPQSENVAAFRREVATRMTQLENSVKIYRDTGAATLRVHFGHTQVRATGEGHHQRTHRQHPFHPGQSAIHVVLRLSL